MCMTRLRPAVVALCALFATACTDVPLTRCDFQPQALCVGSPGCVPDCDGRECGPDPECGFSCGACGPDSLCDAEAGQCEACDHEALWRGPGMRRGRLRRPLRPLRRRTDLPGRRLRRRLRPRVQGPHVRRRRLRWRLRRLPDGRALRPRRALYVSRRPFLRAVPRRLPGLSELPRGGRGLRLRRGAKVLQWRVGRVLCRDLRLEMHQRL